MDAHDVKAEYWEMIKSQKQTLKEAKKRRGQRPQDRKPRKYAYMRFMMSRQPMMRENTEGLIHSSFTAPAYPPCITTVDELKQIKIQDLQLETHHRGVYLLLRCITPPSRMTAIMALVEDENEDVAMLQIYQQEDEEIRPAAEIANTGTVLLVKEPYYKVMGDGEYGLRVDHLSDVVQLKGNNARIPSEWQSRVIEVGQSVESLKQKGNLAMKEGRFWEAITIYSDALEQAAACEEADVLKRNRSLAFLRTKQFD
ncbi:hypothetical protein V501_01174 [Pseudogymnoascus sp. VKM F-4519 (FW-2642)]|nr:hypothetical protein V501_01174 [Pseudogymnoascus sp. VKM F-4519 (FW-2642)]